MPSSMIKSFAKKAGKSVEKVEKIWDKAKQSVTKRFPEKSEEERIPIIVGLVKHILGVDETAQASTTVSTAKVGSGQSGAFSKYMGIITRSAKRKKKK